MDPPARLCSYSTCGDDQIIVRNTLYEMLPFDGIDLRLSSLGLKEGKTCKWFLDQDNYKSWRNKERMEEHNGIIWIQGKPGAGKSYLMKHLFEEAVDEAKKNPNALVHREDIERYIKSKLSSIYENENCRRFMGLQSSILEKSRGIFLQVSLVIEILNDQIVEDLALDLETYLQQIPEKLKDSFGLMLRRNQHQNSSSQLWEKESRHNEIFQRSTH
ncbi:hypothetical protein ACJ73_05314 [Blastomyces percursus]|uniref:Nephrocystin 3-like N-terminal domain-containing protein n=1 Tax=Blastomyces percursus TaxID=1658174 RepID=A0A1J9R4A3_9EURO|nr:hypothetical protein ACJ73_05314 [Blastomyces percursus]